MMKKTRLSENKEKERLELYNQGLSCREIARRLNVYTGTISNWARTRGLKPNYKKGVHFIQENRVSFLPEEENQKRIDLYKQGLTDKEIAAKCFVCKDAIFYWRKKRGLPPNGNRKKGK